MPSWAWGLLVLLSLGGLAVIVKNAERIDRWASPAAEEPARDTQKALRLDTLYATTSELTIVLETAADALGACAADPDCIEAIRARLTEEELEAILAND